MVARKVGMADGRFRGEAGARISITDSHLCRFLMVPQIFPSCLLDPTSVCPSVKWVGLNTLPTVLSLLEEQKRSMPFPTYFFPLEK